MKKADIAPFFEVLRAANPQPQTELEFTNVFELLAAVLLSAQATDVSVNKATRRLFAVANSPQKILEMGLPALTEHIRTIGLFRTKAKNLYETCRLLVERHGGEVPRTREALEALPGVGRKTANVVLGNAFGIPGITVETKIPGYGDDHSTSCLLDGDPETFFWSSRNLDKDETLTWILPEPMALKAIELQSGMPNGTKDQILDAVMEISENGTDFTKASGFQYGSAKADTAGRKIKAIRLRSTGKSPGWVILQDLILQR